MEYNWKNHQTCFISFDFGDMHFSQNDLVKGLTSALSRVRKLLNLENDAAVALITKILKDRPTAVVETQEFKSTPHDHDWNILKSMAPYAGSKNVLDVIASVISFKPDDTPLFVLITGATESGKTYAVKLFDIPQIVNRYHRITARTLEGGSANTDDFDKTWRLMEVVNGKTLAIDDLTSVLSGDTRTIETTLASFTTTYGDGERVASPGGEQVQEGSYNFLACVTPEKVSVIRKHGRDLGHRFVMWKHKPASSIEHGSSTTVEEWKALAAHFLLKIREKPLPSIPSQLKSVIENFVNDLVEVRSCFSQEVSGIGRTLGQMHRLVQSRARLYQREPTTDDFIFFAPMFLATIPYYEIYSYVGDVGPTKDDIKRHVHWLTDKQVSNALAKFMNRGVIYKKGDHYYVRKDAMFGSVDPEMKDFLNELLEEDNE